MLSRESRYLMIHTPPSIDAEFASLIPPLTPEEYKALSVSIQEEGCRDPLVIWESDTDGPVLLDGHNRLRICEQLGVHYRLLAVPDVQNRAQAKLWMLKNQLARRNLTPEQASQLRGQRYNLERHAAGRPSRLDNVAKTATLRAAEEAQPPNRRDATAERLADEYKVSPRTIRTDAQYAAAVDTLTENVGPEVRQDILAGKSPLGKADIIALAETEPAEQQRVLTIADKPAILAAAKHIKEERKAARQQARDADLTDEQKKARDEERRWREDGEFGRTIQRLYVVAHSTTPDHAAEVMIQFGLARVFIQATVDQMEEGAGWLRDCSRALRQHLGTQTPLRKVE